MTLWKATLTKSQPVKMGGLTVEVKTLREYYFETDNLNHEAVFTKLDAYCKARGVSSTVTRHIIKEVGDIEDHFDRALQLEV